MPPLADRSATPPRYSHAPVALSLTLADLVTADGHRVSAALSVVLRLLERPADLAVFNEQIASERATVTLDDVRQYLIGPLGIAAAEHVSTKPAEVCVQDTLALQAALLEHLNAIGFGCGLEFLPPMSVQVSSDSLAAERLAAAALRRQSAALEHAVEIQARLQAAGGAVHLSVADQAELLPMLLSEAAATPAQLWLAAGPRVIAIDLPGRTANAIDAPAALGPLRSVRSVTVDNQPLLAVGGQRGVALIDSASAAPPRLYLADTASSARGFNAVIYDANTRQLIAAHGELGIIRWPINSPAAPQITPLPGARLLTRLDDRMLLAVGGDIVVAGDTLRTIVRGESAIIALLDLDDALVAVRNDGEITRYDCTTLDERSTFHRPTPLRCAALLRVSGLRVLLLGTDAGTLDCVTPTGQVLTQLRPRAGASLLAAASGTIAALSTDRSAIEFLDGDANSRPAATLNLVARFGHRATDLATS